MKNLKRSIYASVGVVLILLGAWPLSPLSTASADPLPQAAPAPELNAFQLVAPGAGWALLGQQLHWTSDGGQQWREITPPGAAGLIAAVTFVEAQSGWVVTVDGGDGRDPAYRLWRTTDGGATWASAPLDLFAAGDPAALPGAVFLDFIDDSHGWLVVKQATSSAFNQGALFATTDGGATWTRREIPAGAPVQFSTPLDGALFTGPPEHQRYITADGGLTWTPEGQPAPAETRADGVSEISWATAEAGWGRLAVGECDEAGCALETRLVQTSDGGQTWVPVPLPNGQKSLTRAFAVPASAASGTAVAGPGHTLTFTGQGFDSCVRPTTEQMQAWYTHSPYKVWNLYIGGSSRFSGCGTLTSDYVRGLAQQGWLFIPTWVGPQPPCSNVGRNRKISWDLSTAYNEGIGEALMALDAAEALGLTAPGQAGTLIYYDIENYPNNSACRAAAQAFVSGWTATLRANGSRSGVYGSPCSSYVADLVNIAHVPDAVWLAAWSLPAAYNASASVWNLPCINNSLWSQGQRLRQYAGDHSETWGGVALPIDSNVLAGPVAAARTSCVPAANQVALYFFANFAGRCVILNIGDYPTHDSLGAFWDQVSSVRVGANVTVRLCERQNYLGVCETLNGSDRNLADNAIGDNIVSSLRVLNVPPARSRLWFPTSRVSAPVTAAVNNGNFESGPAVWAASSARGMNVIVPNNVLAAGSVSARSGAWAAWLGGVHTETVTLQQTINLTLDAPILSYWHWVRSAETGCYYDVASVWVNNSLVESYGLCGNSGGWVRQSVNLSAFAGGPVTLRFQVTTDASLTSSLFIDDVSLRSGP